MSDAVVLGLFALALLIVYLLLRWRGKPPAPPAAPRPLAVIDGSNVMHWRDNTPQLAVVDEVLRRLNAHGYDVGVMFDANAGYRIAGRYLHDGDFRRLLNIRGDRVMVVPKGTPADPFLLSFARGSGAAIVTNDRFRDWLADFPEFADPSRLIRGGFRDGRLWLDLPE